MIRNRIIRNRSIAAIAGAFVFAQLCSYAVAQTPGTDEKKPDQKTTESKPEQAKNQPETVGPRRATVDPKPASKTGLEIPQPTVVLKPGEVPAVKFDTPEYDFGRVQAGGDIVHDYFFTNTGNGPLEILRVKPSCGCTTAGEHTRIVQPGETGKIPIKLSSKKAGGNVSKTITVNTNIPGNDATIRLTIKGTVWQPIEVTPRSAAFGRITADKANDSLERRLTIVNNVEAPLKPTIGESNNPMFKAELKVVEDGKKYEVIVGLVPPISSGNNTGKITIATGMADPATIEIPAYAFVTAPIDVTPTQLTIMPGRSASLNRQFYIRGNDGKEFEIKDLKCNSSKIGMELTDVRGNKQTYRLTVDIPADYAPPANGDRITFNTTHPAIPSMEIPITSRGNETAVKRTGVNQRVPVKNGITPVEAKKPESMKPVG